jgi:hypothetical protein
MRPCGSGWSKISAWRKKQELCVVGLEAAGAGYMRLSHRDAHVTVDGTCAISPAQERRMGLWGSLRHKTQASFSVALPVTDVVTLAQLDADPCQGPRGRRPGCDAVSEVGDTDCGRLPRLQHALIAPLAIAPGNHAMSLAASHPTPPTPTSIIRSLHLPSHRAAPCVFRQRRSWHWPIIKAP